MGRSVVVFVIQAAGVVKMASRAAQAPGLLVHQLGECLPGSAYMAGQGIGALIGRGQHQSVKAVPHGQDIPFINAGAAASSLHIVYIVMGKCNHLIQIALFQHNQGCQYLGDTGRVIGLVHVFSIKNRPGVGVHDNARVSLDGHIRGPFGGCRCCYGEKSCAQAEAYKQHKESLHPNILHSLLC